MLCRGPCQQDLPTTAFESHRRVCRASRNAQRLPQKRLYFQRRRQLYPEKIRAKNKRWAASPNGKAYRRRKNQKYWAQYGAARRDKLNAIYVYFRDRAQCHLCKKLVKPEDISLDHLLPVVDDGPTTYENIKLAHRRCNHLKGTRPSLGQTPVQLQLFG